MISPTFDLRVLTQDSCFLILIITQQLYSRRMIPLQPKPQQHQIPVPLLRILLHIRQVPSIQVEEDAAATPDQSVRVEPAPPVEEAEVQAVTEVQIMPKHRNHLPRSATMHRRPCQPITKILPCRTTPLSLLATRKGTLLLLLVLLKIL